MNAWTRWVGAVGLACLAGVAGGVRAEPPPVPAPAAARAVAEVQREGDPFRPSVHGFRFVNSFTGSAMPPELRDAEGGVLAWARGVAERHIDMPERFGLCGGMSLLAADYYLAGEPIPDTEAAPESGSALYDAIYGRQRDSLGPGSGYVFKFSQWMALPDATPERGAADGAIATDAGDGPDAAGGAHAEAIPTSTSAGTRAELPSICRDLEAGRLVPLGLVLTRAGRGRLWNNHQVLGYGVVRVDDATLHIHIYDPNYPGDDGCVLRVEGIGVGLLGLEEGSDEARALRAGEPSTRGETVRTTRLTSGGRATSVRGVFRMPCEARVPAE